MLPTLNEQITDARLLARGAEERGDEITAQIHRDRVDALLERVPRPTQV